MSYNSLKSAHCFKPRNNNSKTSVVAIAQLVEPRIVIPVVEGSSPFSHPIFIPLKNTPVDYITNIKLAFYRLKENKLMLILMTMKKMQWVVLNPSEVN